MGREEPGNEASNTTMYAMNGTCFGVGREEPGNETAVLLYMAAIEVKLSCECFVQCGSQAGKPHNLLSFTQSVHINLNMVGTGVHLQPHGARIIPTQTEIAE